ncbi:MAG: hypothetical protein EXR11_02395 [Rhodospirillaceae bacterium]|nr:hypothetical protein [Rhodospirillaceae bacterium]
MLENASPVSPKAWLNAKDNWLGDYQIPKSPDGDGEHHDSLSQAAAQDANAVKGATIDHSDVYFAHG